MAYYGVFDISASGMDVEKTRLNIASLNLANINTTRTAKGGPYQPLTVVTKANTGKNFGVIVDQIQASNGPSKMVYEPKHPDANEKCFVSYPDINPVTEMINLINITRSYEANVRALNAAKKMMQSALQIGAGK